MKESDVEKYLVDEVKKRGGICPKFVSPGLRGVPDRIVCLPGWTVFVELKAPGENLRKQQKLRRKQFEAAGQTVYAADTKKLIANIMSFYDYVIAE